MNYLVFSIGTALFFALTFFLRKQATKTISLTTAFLIEAITETIILIIIFLYSSTMLKRGVDVKLSGALYAILAGATVTIGVGLNYLALKTGFLSRVTAITSPSQIIFALFLGVLLLGDSLTIRQLAGIALGIISVILLTL